jgi:hypothetical protein
MHRADKDQGTEAEENDLNLQKDVCMAVTRLTLDIKEHGTLIEFS